MFKNLDAEQARAGMTNLNVAEKLGISRVSYENKKKTGKFTTLEIKCLCKLFSCKFDYLFATEERQKGENMEKSLLNAMRIISCELGIIIGLLLSISIRI